jgi:cytochrome c peroxidase
MAPDGHAGAYNTLNPVVAHYFNPTGAAAGPLLTRAWCTLPPFDIQPHCESHADTALANTRATLDSIRNERDTSSDIALPLIPVELSNQRKLDDVVAFLETLADPCLSDRPCCSRWIPEPDGAPNEFQIDAIGRDGNEL